MRCKHVTPTGFVGLSRIFMVSGLVYKEIKTRSLSTANNLYFVGRFRGSDQAKTVTREESLRKFH